MNKGPSVLMFFTRGTGVSQLLINVTKFPIIIMSPTIETACPLFLVLTSRKFLHNLLAGWKLVSAVMEIKP